MQTVKKTIFYSILFGFAMEFQINILLKHSVSGMIGVLILYSIIGLLTYKTFPFIMRRFTKQSRGFWTGFIVHGLLGLFIVEWVFMENTFSGVAPGAGTLFVLIAQMGMFMWWGTIAAMPYLLQREESLPLRKKIFWYYGAYAVISTTLTIPFGIAPVILLEPPVYLGFIYFYKKFTNVLENNRSLSTS